ncbi:galactosylceramide sulfotransferase-like [Lytechinus variegatus]|uniref:galactosylceramide sulfotransferase-like n=1 Tax=Lytechinus variegatus TaxID=7654 RepID=UPI001BB29B7E|nr:galactosylceramide sulfotransferase-like [Lytechinus variegatus]
MIKKLLPPLGVRYGDFDKYRNYDMSTIHARFYRDIFDKYMANGTHYVTSVRDPADQWESAFHQFNFRRVISKAVNGHEQMVIINSSLKVPFNKGNSTLDAINEFLRKPKVYHNDLKQLGEVVWHFGHNSQMFDLSTDLTMDQIQNETLVNITINKLIHELDAFIVAEYFDESLLVMKKTFCLTFTDILYVSQNKRELKNKLPETTRTKIRDWNRADTLLYSRVNESLWKKIHSYGPDFQKDLKYFKNLLLEVESNCSLPLHKRPFKLNHKTYGKTLKPSASLFCKMVAGHFADILKRVVDKQKSQHI